MANFKGVHIIVSQIFYDT